MSKEYTVNGNVMPLYTIGDLASAIFRDSITVRQWERHGVIPHAVLRDHHGRRLYLRAEVEALVRIMDEENPRAGVALTTTKLKARAWEEWIGIRRREGLIAVEHPASS